MSFSMMVFGTIRYVKDESTSIVDSKAFHATEDDIYPTLSLCLEVHMKKSMTREGISHDLSLPLYNEKLDSKKRAAYVSFLTGNKTNGIEKWIDVDYDEVTVDMNDYLEIIEIRSGKEMLYNWKRNQLQNKTKPLFVSYRHPMLKCFSIDVSNAVPDAVRKGTPINWLDIIFERNNSILDENSKLIAAYFLHYPKQLMRSYALEREHLGVASRHFKKEFYIDNVEVIRKRNTRFSPCKENYKEEDDEIRKQLIKKAGCTPSHWPIDKDYKVRCKTTEQMTVVGTPLLDTVHPEFLDTFKSEEPCSQIYAIAYTMKNFDAPPMCDPFTNAKDPEGKEYSKGNRNDYTTSKPIEEPQENTNDGRNHNHNMDNRTAVGLAKHSGKPNKPTLKKDKSGPKLPGHGHPGTFHGGPLGPPIEKDKNFVDKRPAYMDMMCAIPPSKKISVVFKSSHFKVIKHIQAFTIESWIGNVGGYVGLFLGCAIVDAPDFIAFVFRNIKDIINTITGAKHKRAFFVEGNKN